MTDDDQPVLDFEAGQKAKREALKRVETSHEEWIDLARATAYDLAFQNGEVTADAVRAKLYPLGFFPRHHNAWGAVFKSKDFEFTGEFRPSAVPSRKGNMQRVWRLR